MPRYEFVTVNVFTDRRFHGNPLAVFPDASGLTTEQMQAIAKEFNLSETTFVLPPDDPKHHAKVRIFTPATEMPFAGHPNVGTGYVLATMSENPPAHYTFEELAGLVRVHILRDDGKVTGARIQAPRSLSLDIAIPTRVVAGCIGLAPEAIASEVHTPVVASVGTHFIIAEVASIDALAKAQPDLGAFRDLAKDFPKLNGRANLLLWTRRTDSFTYLRARMFAPLAGVLEDPATGSAAAALAALLTSLAPGENVDLHYEIEQGIEMGRPSLIVASARKTAEGPVSASVAGSCVPVMQGSIEV